MAHATAVYTKIAMIAALRFNMVVWVSTLSAAPPTYPLQLVLSSTLHYKVKARGSGHRRHSTSRELQNWYAPAFGSQHRSPGGPLPRSKPGAPIPPLHAIFLSSAGR